MPIILASQSPRRQELMQSITSDFISCPANIDERVPRNMIPEDYVLLMAQKKAQVVYKEHPSQTVIGCDTIVSLGQQIFGKPRDDAEAYEILQKLSGKEHTVHTGVFIMNHQKIQQKIVSAQVKFFELSPWEIQEYIQTGEHKDKAGAYGIQGKGSLLVERISGDFYSIVGFPVAHVKRMLEEF